MSPAAPAPEWVFLTYSLPRTPSAPRLALWRTLRRLGATQLVNGLVALPATDPTREQFEWAAEGVVAAGGSAGVWLARPTTRAQIRDLATTMSQARAAEYLALIDEAELARAAHPSDGRKALVRLRRENHKIRARDFFHPQERDLAAAALRHLAQHLGAADADVPVTASSGRGAR
ncbi:MAG: chromate resistance protein [Actinobacteria bacterium]|nr:chromate resistance protein [Actinomycetota bacterium]